MKPIRVVPGLVLAVAAMLLSPVPGSAAPPAGRTNLVTNGSFEAVSGSIPENWQTSGDSGVKQALSTDDGKTGTRCAVLRCTSFTHSGPASHAMLAQVGELSLTKGRTYRFACWLRAQGLRSRHVRVAVSDTSVWTNCGLNAGLAVGRAWRRYEVYFTATRTVSAATRLQFWFNETGTLWIDGVEIVPVSQLKAVYTRRIAPGESRNLLPNGSFECGRSGWASLGQDAGWGNMSGLHGQVRKADAVHGEYCLRIDLGPGKTPVSYFDYFQPVRVEQHAPLAANVGWVSVERGKAYTLSAWMRADRAKVGGKLLFRRCNPGRWPRTQSRDVVLTKTWRRYAMTIRADLDYLFVAAGPDVTASGNRTATVWIDAVQLEQGDKATGFVPRGPVDVGIETEPFGNVFPAGRPVRLLVGARNETQRAVALELKAEAKDFFGRPVPLPPCRMTVAAGGSTRTDWPLGLREPGYYDVTVSWQDGGKPRSRRMPLAVVARYEHADSPFGINHAPPSAHLCRLLRDVGVVWARDWSLKWQHVEPQPGRFDPKVADVQIDRVRATGMRVICLLPPFPSSDWASTAPPSVASKGYPGNRLRMAYAPKDPELLSAFIARCVRHCSKRVGVWEFLNEPIFTTYSLPAKTKGLPGAAYTVKDYVALLKRVRAAMKQADPRCRVIGGIGAGPRTLTREFFEAGGLDCVDVLNLHIYPDKAPPESYIGHMAELNRRMAARGKAKPIWITEYSYYATDELPWKPFIKPQGWAANRLLRDERQCADYSVRFTLVMLASGVDKVFYHSGAGGRVNQPPLECCLVGYAGTPRKALAAQSALAGVLGPHPRFAGRPPMPKRGGSPVEGLYAYAFDCGNRAVVAAWVDPDVIAARWSLRAPLGADVLDIVGRRMKARSVELTSSPVYIVARAIPAARLAGACRLSLAAE